MSSDPLDNSNEPSEAEGNANHNVAARSSGSDVMRETHKDKLSETVGTKVDRMIRARGEVNQSVWFGFGAFGVIGWSVAVPAVLCIFIGVWIDTRWPSPYSWTLMLLFIGIVLGCLNAWYWLSRERKKIDR